MLPINFLNNLAPLLVFHAAAPKIPSANLNGKRRIEKIYLVRARIKFFHAIMKLLRWKKCYAFYLLVVC
jgi:hypothetical protein